MGRCSYTCCFSWTFGSSLKCNVSLFNRYCSGRYFSILAELMLFLILVGSLLIFLISGMIFLSLFQMLFRWLYHLSHPWNSLLAEYCPMPYNLNGFKYSVNRCLSSLRSLVSFPLCFCFLCVLFLVTTYFVVGAQPCVEQRLVKQK